MQPDKADLDSDNPDTENGEMDHPDHANEVDQAFGDGAENAQLESAAPSDTAEQRALVAEKEALVARAELENYRKRVQRDTEMQLKYANLPLVKDLLDVWDNLQRAMDAADADDPATKALREGVGMVSQQMTDVLGRYGCKRVSALGEEFDPNIHEAISQMASDEYASGTVMNEVAVGYLLHDRVVRPSHVIVSTGAASDEA